MVASRLFLAAMAIAVGVFATPLLAAVRSLEGDYRTEGSIRYRIHIRNLRANLYRVWSPARWDGVGLFDGKTYWGVFRYGTVLLQSDLKNAEGFHRAALQADGSLIVTGELTRPRRREFEESWERVESPSYPVVATSGRSSDSLAEGVEPESEPPLALKKVGPRCPEHSGSPMPPATVTVQVLVGEDGRVKDDRILESIPALDSLAVQAVRQWIFRPGRANGGPVAAWVAIPIRFVCD